MSPQRELVPPQLLPWPYVYSIGIRLQVDREPSSSWKSQVSNPSHLRSLQDSTQQCLVIPSSLQFRVGLLPCTDLWKNPAHIHSLHTASCSSFTWWLCSSVSQSEHILSPGKPISLPASVPAEAPNLRPGWANAPSRAPFWWDQVAGPAHVGPPPHHYHHHAVQYHPQQYY